MSQQINSGRPLRADAERTVQTILEAAERTLGRNPAATMEDIAAAPGVARTTVNRRFATREALITAMASWATKQFAAAVDAARPDTAPPVVALYQATANVLRVKIGWGFSMSSALIEGSDLERVYAGIVAKCDRLFRRAQEAGIVRHDADLIWGRRVYYALIARGQSGRGTRRGLQRPRHPGRRHPAPRHRHPALTSLRCWSAGSPNFR